MHAHIHTLKYQQFWLGNLLLCSRRVYGHNMCVYQYIVGGPFYIKKSLKTLFTIGKRYFY